MDTEMTRYQTAQKANEQCEECGRYAPMFIGNATAEVQPALRFVCGHKSKDGRWLCYGHLKSVLPPHWVR